jgi:hypothetical protein
VVKTFIWQACNDIEERKTPPLKKKKKKKKNLFNKNITSDPLAYAQFAGWKLKLRGTLSGHAKQQKMFELNILPKLLEQITMVSKFLM